MPKGANIVSIHVQILLTEFLHGWSASSEGELRCLQHNGFEVEVSKDGRQAMEELVLVAQPVSKRPVFDMKGVSIPISHFCVPLSCHTSNLF